MTRSSTTHPLRVAELAPCPEGGVIGITFCPGKKDPYSQSGPWDRDLAIDLDAVADWGAAAVVSLVEEGEFGLLGISGFGEAVRRRHMDWLHLPVRDVSVPDQAFERDWQVAGAGLRARLRSGARVLVHCRGGLGRAGTIAARLAVELGEDPEEAIRRVRAVRPGAIETAGQERHVRACRPVPEPVPAPDPEAVADRAVGALLGLAVGDAVGTALEFARRDDAAAPLTDMTGGGPFGLAPGQWTDDTAMALALGDSLLAMDGLDQADLLDRFMRWWKTGEYSCTGRCFDIGITTRESLGRWLETGERNAGPTALDTAGNGSLMRLAPVAIRFWNDAEARRDAAARQSRTTHGAAEAVDACVLYADMLAETIAGAPRSAVLAPRKADLAERVAAIAGGSWRGRHRADIRGSGYVVHALEAAIWCVARTSDFRSAVLMAANLREDADTTAAIAGQLAGALYGASGIPADWRRKVAWGERIEAMARALLAAAPGASTPPGPRDREAISLRD